MQSGEPPRVNDAGTIGRLARERSVAARLQTAADPGSILCGFRTYALVKDRVRAEERGALSVKGALRPVEAWEIVSLTDP